MVVHDSKIANEKSEDLVEVPGGKRLQINSGGNGDAISFRARGVSLLGSKFSEDLGGRREKCVVDCCSMFFCEQADVIDSAIGKVRRKETGAEVEWVAQMDPVSAAMAEIVSKAGDGGTKPKSRVFESFVVVTRESERRKILTGAAVVHKGTLH